MTICGGSLRLSAPSEPRGQRHPIDVFFETLAENSQKRAIGIVLSGTGTDGTHGLREIKARGGMTLVQDLESAQFNSMPSSAILAGVADQVLAPEKMPEALLRYVQHGYIAAPAGIETGTPDEPPLLEAILKIAQSRSGHEFGSYKRSTLLRRIHRRMGLNDLKTLAEYAELLRANQAEIRALSKDLMISVTSFFRDPEAWEALDASVLARVVAERETGAPMRFWVPACASGEEAYSLAMLSLERAEAAGKQFDVKIFATDPQEGNLRAAREGIYPVAAAKAISAERLRHFFVKEEAGYRVKKEIREDGGLRGPGRHPGPALHPARPSLLPQSDDLPGAGTPGAGCSRTSITPCAPAASCSCPRPRAPGTTPIGSSRSTGSGSCSGSSRHGLPPPPFAGSSPSPRAPRGRRAVGRNPRPRARKAKKPALAELTARALLQAFAPPSVVTNRWGDILYVHGDTGRYLRPAPGHATLNVIELARPGASGRAARRLPGRLHGKRLGPPAGGRMDRGRQDPGRPADGATAGWSGGRRAPARDLPGCSSRPDGEGQAGQGRGPDRGAAPGRGTGAHSCRIPGPSCGPPSEEQQASTEEQKSMNEELQSTNEELDTVEGGAASP